MSRKRRLHPRAVVRLPARVQARGNAEWTEVLLYDLSAGGAGILAPVHLPVQSELTLGFRLPDGEADEQTIDVECLVVRTGTPAASDPERPHLIGLHFLDLSSEEFDRVRVFVWNRVYEDPDSD